jgi:hypothetical protein
MTPQPDIMIYTKKNKYDINNSTECACIACLNIFIPEQIINWIVAEDINAIYSNDTAICPYCSSQLVIDNNRVQYTPDMLYMWHIDCNFNNNRFNNNHYNNHYNNNDYSDDSYSDDDLAIFY